MWPLDILRKVSRRLHADSFCYPLLARLVHKRMDIRPTDVQAAVERLAVLSPDRGESCLCTNTILNPAEVDLQIIIPAYNAEDYIDECLRSVVEQQTHYKICIVVVNDGSTDATRHKLKAYEGRPEVIIIDQPNRGFSGARNAGLSLMRGRYVMFLDADDRLAPQAVDNLMDKAEASGADITEGGYQRFRNAESSFFSFRHEETETDDWTKLYSYPWGKVYRATLFADVHFPEGYWFEDTLGPYIVHPRAIRIATVSDIVYYYRDNAQGISRRSTGQARNMDALWVSRRLLEDNELLAIRRDERLYRTVLADFRTNFSRIHSLRSSQTDRDLFVVAVDLLRRHFPDIRVTDSSLHPLEQALRTSDYSAYYFYCLFHSF